MEATKRSNSEKTEKTMNELGTAVRQGEELLEQGAAETTSELRAKLQAAIDKAKALYERLEEKTVAAAKTTDRAVHQHPYEAMGVAFGVGLLIGVLAARSRRD